MSRIIEAVDLDIAKIRAEIKKLNEQLQALQKERDEVLTAKADHPWLGKKVKATVDQQTGDFFRRSLRTVTFRGVVDIHKGREHRGVSGVAYNQAGDIIVLSASGKKGWPLEGRIKWQLDQD